MYQEQRWVSNTKSTSMTLDANRFLTCIGILKLKLLQDRVDTKLESPNGLRAIGRLHRKLALGGCRGQLRHIFKVKSLAVSFCGRWGLASVASSRWSLDISLAMFSCQRELNGTYIYQGASWNWRRIKLLWIWCGAYHFFGRNKFCLFSKIKRYKRLIL